MMIPGILFLTGCKQSPPDKDIIEKAKKKTMFILDSLKNNENVIIGEVTQNSEFFDDDEMEYHINYNIETGLDSAHITTTESTVFLEKAGDRWEYRFVFDKTYDRKLETE
jgi:hypothetical protein